MAPTTSPLDGHGQIDIRLLAGLFVRRPDGSVVDPAEWRTTKTADLFRLLAVRDGQPASCEGLLATFWPRVDRHRAQASLRTATSQIRHVLGRQTISRSPLGLALAGASCDVARIHAAASRTRGLVGQAPPDAVLACAEAGLELCTGDLEAHDPGADWVVTARRVLAEDELGLLGAAAEAALHCRHPFEARAWARRLVVLDEFSEHGCRLLMRACAADGEASAALRVFESHRRQLRDELGIDPSPETQQLYLQLLRGDQLQRGDQLLRGDGHIERWLDASSEAIDTIDTEYRRFPARSVAVGAPFVTPAAV